MKTPETPENKEDIIETFTMVEFGDDSEGDLTGVSKTSFTKTAFCTGAANAGSSRSLSSRSKHRKRRKGDVSLVPNRDQMSTEYSKFNPVWLMFPLLNLFIDLFKMIFEIFWFVFKIVFFQTYEIMVPDEFNFGLKSGKKYCFNLMPFRFLITFLCPPMGVFMAYGIRGFVQIGICAVLSLMFYVPGLVYGLVVIMRSDVAEYLEQTEIGNCTDEGLDVIFSSDEDEEKPKCSKKPGDKCSLDRKPMPGNPKKLNCCMQPEYDAGADDWLYNDGTTARDYQGNSIAQFADGETKCKVDYTTKLAPEGGICVYKKSGRPA